MEKTDEEIILACHAGDKEAFRELVERYSPPLYNFLARIAGRTNATDLSQETFLKAWKNLRGFDVKRASFKTWLFTIARNTATDFLRKKKIPTLPEREDGEDPFSEIPDEELLPDRAMEKLQDTEFLNGILEKLPPDYRMVLVLHYEEEMTFDEIGKVMGKPLNTVKSAHRRAILTLRRMLE